MTLAVRLHHYQYQDYLSLEEHSPVRHEFVDGEIYAMAGGTPEHAALAAAILRVVGNQLPSGCRAYSSDLRVRISAADTTTYPDGAIVCGHVLTSREDALAAINPVIVIEVTSDSTEDYDRGPKLAAYQALQSVREVVLVSHRERRLVVYARDEGGAWCERSAVAGGFVTLESTGVRLCVDEVYRDSVVL